jgi:hypothetical protein
MPPAILLARFGQRGWPVALPIFLLWPFALLAALAVGLLRVFLLPARRPQSDMWRLGWVGLCAFCQMHGTKVDLRSNDGERIRLSFI